jgi:hypothetical protein
MSLAVTAAPSMANAGGFNLKCGGFMLLGSELRTEEMSLAVTAIPSMARGTARLPVPHPQSAIVQLFMSPSSLSQPITCAENNIVTCA